MGPIKLTMRTDKNYNRNQWKWWQKASAFCFVFTLMISGFNYQQGSMLKKIENFIFDEFQALKPRQSVELPVFVIAIDEKAIDDFGQWPWPRNILADLIYKLKLDYEVAAIGIDVIFSEKDRSSPTYSKFPASQDPNLAAKVNVNLDYDNLLATSILQSGNVVLPIALSNNSKTKPPRAKATINMVGQSELKLKNPYFGRLANLEILERSASGLGVVNALTEYDGIVRETALFSIFSAPPGQNKNLIIPSFSVEVLRIFLDQKSYLIKKYTNSTDLSLRVGQQVTGMNINGSARLFYNHLDPDKYISVSDIFVGKHKNKLNEAVVLIGVTAGGITDKIATPLGQSIPGVEVHRQTIENVLTNSFLDRSNITIGIEILSSMILVIVVALFCILLGPVASALSSILISFMATAVCWIAFGYFSTLINPMIFILTILGTWIILSTFKRISENQKKRVLTEAFGRYVSPAYVETIIRSPDLLNLGGSSRILTILFCDIRRFTEISEIFREKPEVMISLLNDILEPLTQVILKYNGTIDKYLGDGIMAFWNAPLEQSYHAELATQACFELTHCIVKVREDLSKNEQYQAIDLAQLSIGVGMNTGLATVGNIGSQHRFDYSVIGDAVNLTARLESQCKNYKLDNIVSEDTLNMVKDAGPQDILDPALETFPIDCIKVVGRQKPALCYTLISKLTRQNGKILEKHSEFFVHYSAGDFLKASLVLKELVKFDTTLQHYYFMMLQRCEELNASEKNDWKGFYEASTK